MLKVDLVVVSDVGLTIVLTLCACLRYVSWFPSLSEPLFLFYPLAWPFCASLAMWRVSNDRGVGSDSFYDRGWTCVGVGRHIDSWLALVVTA